MSQDDNNPVKIDEPPPTARKNVLGLFTNPSTRPVIFLTIGALFVAGVVVVAKFRSGSTAAPAISGASIAPAPADRADPNLTPSQRYQELASKDAQQGAEAAGQTGKSFIPAVDISKSQPTPLPVPEAQKPLPSNEFTSYSSAPAANPNRERMFAAVQTRIGQLAEQAKAPATHAFVKTEVADGGDSGRTILRMGGEGGNRLESVDAAGRSAATVRTPLAKAGSMVYATTDLEINTDFPAPTVVTVSSGPLKGARLIGTPQLSTSAVILPFRTMSLPKGTANSSGGSTISVNAFAIDQNTDSNALATSVDRHYLSRYGALLSAALLRGLGEAYARSGATVTQTLVGTTTTYASTSNKQIAAQAGGEVGKAVADAVGQNFNRPATVVVARGTPIAILFIEDVLAPTGSEDRSSAATQGGNTSSIQNASNTAGLSQMATPAPATNTAASRPVSPLAFGTPTTTPPSNNGGGLIPLPNGAVVTR